MYQAGKPELDLQILYAKRLTYPAWDYNIFERSDITVLHCFASTSRITCLLTQKGKTILRTDDHVASSSLYIIVHQLNALNPSLIPNFSLLCASIVDGIRYSLLDLLRQRLLKCLRYLAVADGVAHFASLLIAARVVDGIWQLMLQLGRHLLLDGLGDL